MSALLVLAIMVGGSVVLWVGLPFAWLWIASQVQGATDSLGAALGTAAFGFLVTMALLVTGLVRLSEHHRALRLTRGHDDLGHLPLEVVLVCSATVTMIVFAVWFFLFSGTSPIPLNLSV